MQCGHGGLSYASSVVAGSSPEAILLGGHVGGVSAVELQVYSLTRRLLTFCECRILKRRGSCMPGTACRVLVAMPPVTSSGWGCSFPSVETCHQQNNLVLASLSYRLFVNNRLSFPCQAFALEESRKCLTAALKLKPGTSIILELM